MSDCTPKCPMCGSAKHVIPAGENAHTFGCTDCKIMFEDVDDGTIGKGRPEKYAQRNENHARAMRERRARTKMKPYFQDHNATLYHGDSLDVLRTLPTGVVQCCITSPPYYALRSYLDKDDPLKAREIGSEPMPEAFIATMVDVFREVRRVLRDDGTLFLNLGDSYDSGTNKGRRFSATNNLNHPYWKNQEIDKRIATGLGAGQLLNISHRVAEALRQDGWIWRQTIIWAKRSPMPESLGGTRWVRCKVKIGDGEYIRGDKKDAIPASWNTAHEQDNGDGNFTQAQKRVIMADCPGCDKCRPHGGYVLRRGQGRCTSAFEYVFLMTKTNRYFWDGEASKEKAANNCTGRTHGMKASGANLGEVRSNVSMGSSIAGIGVERRNPRSFWLLSSEPTKLRHFAAFPSELVRRCLVAGCSAGGCCSECGEPLAPVVESCRVPTCPGLANKIWKHDDGDRVGQRSESAPNLDPQRHIAVSNCSGYRPTCECNGGVRPQIVLDPFAGIATTGQTAIKLGHAFIGVDLNEKYLEASQHRIFEPPRWWLRQQKPKAKKPRARSGDKLLF